MNTQSPSENKPRPWRKIVIWAVLLILAIFIAQYTFTSVSKLIATWDITNLPGLAISQPTPTLAPGEEPVEGDQTQPESETNDPIIVPSGPDQEPWDGASRVTVLLVGLDYNDWRGGTSSPLSDTMMLLTLDPIAKTAGVLSIPRDLWVSIPGFDYGKINTAYQLGDAYDLPGGGPGLAMETVEKLIGVPIQYYAQIDFTAFVRFIDEIGGVKVTLPKKIFIDIYDDPKGKFKLDAGTHTLPGEYALAYARARNTEGGDFDRAQRQQQVLMGIRDRFLKHDLFTVILPKAPILYQELSSGINTNLNLDEALQLAWLALQIPRENIKQGIIGADQVAFGKSPDGLDVLKPLPDQIRLLRDDIFTATGAINPAADPAAEAMDLMLAENAKIKILNGTFTVGIGGRTGEYFQSLGANVVEIGDAAEKPFSYTFIYDHTGNPYTVQYFVDLMQISKYRIVNRFAPDNPSDVTIITGNDWTNNNPMP
jgi:polyisoprenyl-teichoic acid--peptidoglycan teichoic acid transferase